MQNYFQDLISDLKSHCAADEFFAANFRGEATDFCRFNRGKIRQAGSLVHRNLDIRLLKNGRHAKHALDLTGILSADRDALKAAFAQLRQTAAHLQPDPHALFSQEVRSTELRRNGQLPAATDLVGEVISGIGARDFVGIYVGGPIFRGFANSLGQVNWYENTSYNLDWSIYVRTDKAAKASMAGTSWKGDVFRDRIRALDIQTDVLNRDEISLKPGPHRVYLAPAAMEEVVSTMSWGCFGMDAQRTKASPLIKMSDQGFTVDPRVTLQENTADGVAPNFDPCGFTKPAVTSLIEKGKLVGSLVCARTAKEYGVNPTGANDQESPESLDMKPGELSTENVLKELQDGIMINNLWYLNYSDRATCRLTGMTRFACFEVKSGAITRPCGVMRFDDSFLKMFGENLIGLTKERDLILDTQTYGGRSTGSKHLPGALIKDFALTL